MTSINPYFLLPTLILKELQVPFCPLPYYKPLPIGSDGAAGTQFAITFFLNETFPATVFQKRKSFNSGFR